MRAAEVALTDEEHATLRSWLAAGKTERRMAFRAAVILAVAEGLSNAAVAARLGTRPATVSKWRGRFARAGLSGLADAPRSGKPSHYEAAHERRILAALDEPPPAGYGRWDGALLARHLGDISKHQIWRVLRRHEISLARRRSWCISTDTCFARVGGCPAYPRAIEVKYERSPGASLSKLGTGFRNGTPGRWNDPPLRSRPEAPWAPSRRWSPGFHAESAQKRRCQTSIGYPCWGGF
jgi:transposase